MGISWLILMFLSIAFMIFNNPNGILTAFSTSAGKAITLSTTLCGVYAVWLGFMEILNDTKLTDKLKKLLNPIIVWLFGEQPSEIKNLLAENIAGNLLGIGGISTPSGILATEKMQGENETIIYPVMMLILLSSSSIQIIPTTIIGLRASSYSATPADILLPAIITTFITSLISIIAVKFYYKRRTKRGKN